MLLALAAAMFLNDARIDADPATATATVLTVTPLRTGIEFVGQDGVAVRPTGGVLYPGLLQVDQQFVVEYATDSPEVVRVAGRTAGNGLIMLAFAALGTWLVAGPLMFLLGRPTVALGRDRQMVG